MRHKFTAAESRKGGKRVANQKGGTCPRCGATYKTHAALAGHMGLHSFIDKWVGDVSIETGRLAFCITGAAAGDPIPENGAYIEGHKILAKIRKELYGQEYHP